MNVGMLLNVGKLLMRPPADDGLGTSVIVMEDSFYILTEGGDAILLEGE